MYPALTAGPDGRLCGRLLSQCSKKVKRAVFCCHRFFLPHHDTRCYTVFAAAYVFFLTVSRHGDGSGYSLTQ